MREGRGFFAHSRIAKGARNAVGKALLSVVRQANKPIDVARRASKVISSNRTATRTDLALDLKETLGWRFEDVNARLYELALGLSLIDQWSSRNSAADRASAAAKRRSDGAFGATTSMRSARGRSKSL
jgi:hypothetical protein